MTHTGSPISHSSIAFIVRLLSSRQSGPMFKFPIGHLASRLRRPTRPRPASAAPISRRLAGSGTARVCRFRR
jgi:hypothetical protein